MPYDTQSMLDDDAARQWLRRRGLHLEAPDNPSADITGDQSATPAVDVSGGKLKPEGQDAPDHPMKALAEMPQEAQAMPDVQVVTPTRKPLLHVDAVPPAPAYVPSKLQQAASYLRQSPGAPPPMPAPANPGAVDESGMADELAAARNTDAAARREHNIGEGLRQMLSGFGNQPRYQPQLEQAPSAVGEVQADQAARRKQAADFLMRKRQGEQDALGNRLKESEIEKNLADAEKARRDKPQTGAEDVPGLTDVLSSPAFAEKRSQFGYGTPSEIASASTSITGGKLGDAETSLRPLPPDKEALKELRSSFEGERASEMNKDATIQAAATAASIQRGFQEGQGDKAAAQKLAEELTKEHIPETLATIGSLQKALQQHGGELPGVGPVAGRSLPGGIDTWFRSDEGNFYRNQVQQLQEAHRVQVTGAGAGPTELAMLNQTTISPTDSPKVFAQKLQALEDIVQARRRGTEAGYTGKQLDQYIGQLQAVKQREAPKTTGGGPTRGEIKKLPSGRSAVFDGSKWVPQ